MHRTISGLLWAKPCAKPPSIGIARSRGAKALGRAFERKVAKAFRDAKHGQWYEFCDANGRGYCQPDLVFFGNPIWVLEVKLTDVAYARSQLTELYLPVLAKVHGRPVRGAIVAKHLSPVSLGHKIVSNFDEATCAAGIPIIHWWDGSPLSPSLSSAKPAQVLTFDKNLPSFHR